MYETILATRDIENETLLLAYTTKLDTWAEITAFIDLVVEQFLKQEQQEEPELGEIKQAPLLADNPQRPFEGYGKNGAGKLPI